MEGEIRRGPGERDQHLAIDRLRAFGFLTLNQARPERPAESHGREVGEPEEDVVAGHAHEHLTAGLFVQCEREDDVGVLGKEIG